MLTVPATVTIPANARPRWRSRSRRVAQNTTPVTVTAALNGVMRSGTVRVLGDGLTVDAPTYTTLSPATGKIALGGTTNLTASLDLPAGQPIPLDDHRHGDLDVARRRRRSRRTRSPLAIPITQSGATLMDTITVTDGTNTKMSTLTVGVHPVINEVDYDQTSTDTAEFVELYNPYATAIDLTNLVVVFATGTNADYQRVTLSGSMAANAYIVIASAGVTVPATATKIALPGAIQNGSGTNPTGVAIIDTAAKTVVDSVSFAGAAAGPGLVSQINGLPSPTTFAEGTFKLVVDDPGSTSVPVNGSCVRSPNGQDTDNMTADWSFKTPPTPGAANP